MFRVPEYAAEHYRPVMDLEQQAVTASAWRRNMTTLLNQRRRFIMLCNAYMYEDSDRDRAESITVCNVYNARATFSGYR